MPQKNACLDPPLAPASSRKGWGCPVPSAALQSFYRKDPISTSHRFFHNGCRFRIGNEVMPATGILAVAVWRIIAQKLPCLHLPAKDGTNVFRKLLGIPFIDQTVDLTGFLLACEAVSTPSTTVTKRIPQRGNSACRYFSAVPAFRVKRDCVLHRMIENFLSSASARRR